MTKPDDPPTAIEQRASELGITFTRGRTWTSNSHLALQAAEFAAEHGDPARFHRAIFKSYFEDLDDIGDLDTVVRVGAGADLDEGELRAALVSGRYRKDVDEGIQWAHEAGVSAVPTFVIDGKYGVVGAQELPVFEDLMLRKLGRTPKG